MTTSSGPQEQAPALITDEGALAEEVDAGANANYVERIRINGSGKQRAVRVAQIDYIMAARYGAELHVGNRRVIVREPLHALECRLDPHVFMRIHQSCIVRLACVNEFLAADGGDHEVRLTNGTRLRVSRSRRNELQRRLATSSGST